MHTIIIINIISFRVGLPPSLTKEWLFIATATYSSHLLHNYLPGQRNNQNS